MAVLNFAHREITAKIVYFGATGAGCDTNVSQLWDALEGTEGTRGRLHRFGSKNARETTCFFDIRIPDTEVSGFTVRYRIYSLPGSVDDPTHRDEVMRDVDAIVLVADSRPAAGPGNEDAMLELEGLIDAQGLDLAKLPVVLQVNHLDDDGARAADDVASPLNPFGFPVIEAAAKTGRGVSETFDAITAITRARIEDNLHGEDGAVNLSAVHQQNGPTDDQVAQTHRRALSSNTPPAQTQTSNSSPRTPAPLHEIEVPFQPREFAGSYPVRIMNAAIEDGKIHIDVELEKMGGGDVRQLRVRLANRPTDATAVPRAPSFSMVTEDSVPSVPSVMGVTDHLPDKVTFDGLAGDDAYDLPPITYGIIGVAGGLLIGGLMGFLVFA